MAPAAERHELTHRDGIVALERALLRQVSHTAIADIRYRAAPGSHGAGKRFQQRALASAVRPHDCSHAAGGERSREIFHAIRRP